MKYFTLDEFACKCCGELPAKGMNTALLRKLDELRAKLGCPIIVTSGYRCPRHNQEIGGVDNSQHVKGNAADIYCTERSVYELYTLCLEVGFDGIGYYPMDGFVHVDMRANGDEIGEYNW